MTIDAGKTASGSTAAIRPARLASDGRAASALLVLSSAFFLGQGSVAGSAAAARVFRRRRRRLTRRSSAVRRAFIRDRRCAIATGCRSRPPRRRPSRRAAAGARRQPTAPPVAAPSATPVPAPVRLVAPAQPTAVPDADAPAAAAAADPAAAARHRRPWSAPSTQLTAFEADIFGRQQRPARRGRAGAPAARRRPRRRRPRALKRHGAEELLRARQPHRRDRLHPSRPLRHPLRLGRREPGAQQLPGRPVRRHRHARLDGQRRPPREHPQRPLHRTSASAPPSTARA